MPGAGPIAARGPRRRHASPTVYRYHAVNPHAAMRDTCRVYEYAVPLRNVSLCPHCPRSTPRRVPERPRSKRPSENPTRLSGRRATAELGGVSHPQ